MSEQIVEEFSKEDLDFIKGILEPLNKNPLNSEELNPMAKVFRQKMGYAEPVVFDEEPTQDQELVDEELKSDEDQEEEFEESEPAPPSFRKFEDEDDEINLDELLNQPSISPTSEPEKSEDTDLSSSFEQLGTETWDEFTTTTAPTFEDEEKKVEEDSSWADAFDFPSQKEETFSETPPPSADEGLLDEKQKDTLGGEDDWSFPSSESTSFGEELGEAGGTDFDFPSTPSEDPFADSKPVDDFSDFGVDLDTVSNLDSDQDSSSEGDLDKVSDLEPPDLDEIGEPTSGVKEGVLEDELSSLLEEEKSIEESLTDEDLAIIQQEIIKYPPRLRRKVIDCIVNNRISIKNQKELLELIKHQQPAEGIAEYLSSVLGEEVTLKDPTGAYTDDGVPIIATKSIYTKEGALQRRKLIRNTILFSLGFIFLFTAIVTSYKYIIIPGRAASYYEEGLKSLRLYAKEKDENEKKNLLRLAKENFIRGEEIQPHSLKYLNMYGVEYLKIGRYNDSFEMLFGRVEPAFPDWNKRNDVPIISLTEESKWDDRYIEIAGIIKDKNGSVNLTSQDRKKRKIIKAGAYIVSRLKENIYHKETFINLGRFHSFNSKDFIEDPKNNIYKNDDLAIEYYKKVFTDANDPANIEARAGIAKVYYNKGEYPRAASEYNKIIEIHPKSPIGHGGLLNSYIEIWRRDGNPQFVLNHHRIVKNQLKIEKDLSLYILSKLAGFYIDLDPQETRIRYNVTPQDQVTGLDIDDNAFDILNTIFYKKEKIDGDVIYGNKYAEGYFQRGRYFLKKKEALRAMKQFELAATYDSMHYPAILRMAEYYMYTMNYNEAENLLKAAEKVYKEYRNEYGRRDEDETLIYGDPGRIYFNRGKIIYIQSCGILSTDQIKEFPGRKIYPERAWIKIPDTEINRRRNGLYLASEFFKLANTEPHVLKDPEKRREMIYYTGWIEYMLGNFDLAINIWNDLGEEDLYHNTTLLMGMANSSYYTKQYNSALGYYKKIMSVYEAKEASVKNIVPEDQGHQEIFQTLIAVYNNIGAVFESVGNYQEALAYYWKAIETARKIDVVSEIANSNKDLLMKKQRLGQQPLLEDWLSPTLDTIADMIR